jgi:deferrochelatase/peroxidase EfeB
MAGELVELVNEAWPYVSAAVSGYGAAVLKSTETVTADATVGWGRRLLHRIFGTGEAPEALTDLADDPEDTDLQAALRVQIKKVLATDEQLAADVRQMLEEATAQSEVRGDITNSVTGSKVQGDNIQIGSVGRDATIKRK